MEKIRRFVVGKFVKTCCELDINGEKSPKLAALSLYFTSEVMLSYAGTHPLAVVYTNKGISNLKRLLF